MSSVQSRYRASYDQIAHDHVNYWRDTGENPFQEIGEVERNENATVALIEKHAPDGPWLDAGCGMGDLLMRYPNRERWGTDISAEYVEIALERGLAATRAFIEKPPFPNPVFDLVTACDVLEHVLDLNKAVKGLLKCLKVGGILIVRVPNEEALSINSNPYEYCHLRRFDYPTLYLLFTKIFDVEVLETPVSGQVIHAVVRK